MSTGVTSPVFTRPPAPAAASFNRSRPLDNAASVLRLTTVAAAFSIAGDGTPNSEILVDLKIPSIHSGRVTFMQTLEQRKTKRYVQDARIVFFFLNRAEENRALARNFSRSGMYFEAARPLAAKTLIGIRTIECVPANPAGGSEEQERASEQTGSGVPPDERGCINLKSLVVAEVKRCEPTHGGAARYGIGVHFVSPAV